ncbi:HNH endonuclease [Actinoplanes lobatus]|uniref:HNH endonuclease n=1 Tax=Actinoplanes lobatus TaxID=113568 RepID=A0A7W7HRH4_9ACTN|nr:hypothetical protein [Actinoplanes lobatus]MBB4755249.1 hypothetical protein [Actinoplanes lobatus]GGN88625.1 HNH endonuclease [Actinoplanes lobatus]GIE43455.1 HNH endonuclease [Actinoplanes lobatus]
MIPIIRADLPTDVGNRMAVLTGEIRAVEPSGRAATARETWRRSSTRTDVTTPVRALLARMAPGAERCMYCGDNQGTDIDHHEPLACNPLRTFDWLNHLLACSHCNSHHKRDRYPVDDDGRPLLIDPSAEDPFEHLLLSLSVGEYRPLTEKGTRSIEVFGLNRPILARGRLQAFAVVVMCLRQWREAERGSGLYEPDALSHIIREQPCADVCQAMLRQVESPGAAVVFRKVPEIVRVLRDPVVRRALLR